MTQAAQLSLDNNVMKLSGDINFDNATEVYQQGLALLEQQSSWPLAVDLSALRSSNTITLAIFVQWVRQCKAGQKIVLQHTPEKMQAIITASNLQAAFA